MAHRRDYETAEIRVHWDPARCIHTGICLRALPEVFDTGRRPWVDLDGVGVDAVADAVERCPTGALRYERLDGAPGEEPRRPTVAIPIPDGPLLVAGDLDVRTPEGEPVTREGRLTLCRCGLSRNQPFCDNSHRRRGWSSGPAHPAAKEYPAPREGATEAPTEIVPTEDGSLRFRGHVRVQDADGAPLTEAGQTFLCRCGHSANKPFCDGSHQGVEFRTRAPEMDRDRLEADTPAAFTPNPRVPSPDDAGAGDG